MDGNFAGLTTTTFPLFIEIKNEEDGLTFADASLTQQIELILDEPTVELLQPRLIVADEEDDDDDSNIDLGDLLKYNKKEEPAHPAAAVGAPPQQQSQPQVHAQPTPEVYNCPECSESFESKEIFDIHVSGHTNNMKCAICNMVLKSLKNYEKHCLRCKPYECQICGRIVRFRPNFIKHMRVHTTQQSQRHKYKCEVCHKEFMSFEYFKVHKKIHNGNINLTCGVCGKVFSALASLRGHSKLHTGIKLHKCDICGKGFGQRYNLKIHSRVHTGEMPFECKICKRKLHTQSSFHTHMQTHHSDQLNSDQTSTETSPAPSLEKAEEVPRQIEEEEPTTIPQNIQFVEATNSSESVEKVQLNVQQQIQHQIQQEVRQQVQQLIQQPTITITIKKEVIEEPSLPTLSAEILPVLSDSIKIEPTLDLPVIDHEPLDDPIEEPSAMDTKFHSDFDSDLVDSSDLTTSLSYSNLFDPSSIPESIPDDIYMEDNDSSFQLDQNSIDLSSTTDGNFIKKEWVYSNYSVGQKFDDEDLCEAASFIYD